MGQGYDKDRGISGYTGDEWNKYSKEVKVVNEIRKKPDLVDKSTREDFRIKENIVNEVERVAKEINVHPKDINLFSLY